MSTVLLWGQNQRRSECASFRVIVNVLCLIGLHGRSARLRVDHVEEHSTEREKY